MCIRRSNWIKAEVTGAFADADAEAEADPEAEEEPSSPEPAINELEPEEPKLLGPPLLLGFIMPPPMPMPMPKLPPLPPSMSKCSNWPRTPAHSGRFRLNQPLLRLEDWKQCEAGQGEREDGEGERERSGREEGEKDTPERIHAHQATRERDNQLSNQTSERHDATRASKLARGSSVGASRSSGSDRRSAAGVLRRIATRIGAAIIECVYESQSQPIALGATD